MSAPACSSSRCSANTPASARRYTQKEFLAACERYRAAHGEVVSLCRYEAPPGIVWDDQNYHGEAYGAYAWAIYVAQVAVDTVPTPPKLKISGPCRKWAA